MPVRLKRTLTPTTILFASELRLFKKTMPLLLGPEFVGLFDRYGISFEDSLRFGPVGARCRQARMVRGWSAKDAARLLGVPQYRVNDIEGGQVRAVRGSVLEVYVQLLGLKAWFRRWRNANPKLAAQLADRASKEVASDGGLKRKRPKR